MKQENILRAVEATAVLLFLLQAIRVLFSVLFGIIYDAVFEGPMTLSVAIAHALVLLALLAPLAAPRSGRRRALLIASLLVFLSRVPLTFNDPQWRLYSSLLVVAAGGLYAATLLRECGPLFPQALIAALAGDQLLRAFGNTFDITLRQGWWPYQVIFSVALCFLSWLSFVRSPQRPLGTGLDLWGGLAIGAFLFLETSLLAFPNAVARWSGVSYAALAPALLFVTLLPLLPGVRHWLLRPLAPLLQGLLLLLALCAGLAVGYSLTGFVAAVGLLVAQLSALLALPCASLDAHRGRGNHVGLSLALGLIFFLLINFAYAFAFTYAYTLDFFRGSGLPIVLVAGLLTAIPAVLRAPHAPAPPPRRIRLAAWIGAALLVAICAIAARPPALRLKTAGPNVRVGTYNIHYGYDTHWRFSLEEQAATIEASGADLVALQEVDAGRITSYMVDDALWLARRLRMEVVYQPTVEHLTGIALLSRFPIVETEGRLLTSRLEQTAIVRAKVRVGSNLLNAYGIWLGLEPEERATQLDEALAFIGERVGPAVFGGDFNSRPDSPIYRRIVEAGFSDPFLASGFEPAPTSPAEGPKSRIDYVWMRGIRAVEARVLDSLASDHRMVVVEGLLGEQ